MKNIYSFILSILMGLSFIGLAGAQTPSDAIMMKGRQACVALLYEHSSFDEYWEGARLRTNETIATVRRQMVTPMIAVGIFDRLNLLLGLPYVRTESTEPNGGYLAGAKGLQDLGLALKGELLNQPLGPGRLALLATGGFSTPISNYLSDYRPYSIGSGAVEVSGRGILQYRLNNGLYARGTLAYLWRGQTKAERDYYYNNGSFYSAYMDVPSAWEYGAVLGAWLLNNHLRLEAAYQGLTSTSGDDIRPYNAAQPTNKVDLEQLRFGAQYNIQQLNELGVIAYYAHTLSGRNVGKTSHFGLGITYVFQVGKQPQS